MTLHYQINIRIILAVAVILISGAAAAIWQAKSSVAKEVDSSMNLALQLIKLGIAQGGGNRIESSLWLKNIIALEQIRHIQVRIEQQPGQLLHIKNKSKIQNEMTPPYWFTKAVATAYPNVAYKLKTGDGRHVMITLSADPSDEIKEAWLETRTFCWVVFLLGLGLFLTVNMAFKEALNSVAEIVQGLDAIEHEQYKYRLPYFKTLEFDRIAKAMNRLNETLENAREDNKALMLHSVEIQEEERKQLARELHDEMGQSITAIKVMAVAGKNPKADIQQINNSIIAVCDQIFAVVRAMMRNLHPLALSDLGLTASLEDLVAYWKTRSPGIHFQLNVDDEMDELQQKIAIQIFRIVQEAITNTVRHAEARQMTITLNTQKNTLNGKLVLLEIADDGIGCDASQLSKGFGLMGIKGRINSLGGNAEFVPVKDKGMTILITIPIN